MIRCFWRRRLEAVKHPESLLKNLFQIRARDLLNGDKTGQSHLSGALIGTEIGTNWNANRHANHKPTNPPIVLIGAEGLSNLYARVLDALGIKHQQHTVQSTTIKGLYGTFIKPS